MDYIEQARFHWNRAVKSANADGSDTEYEIQLMDRALGKGNYTRAHIPTTNVAVEEVLKIAKSKRQ